MFLKFTKELKEINKNKNKELIICGDFNVCFSKLDVYIPSNVTEEKAESLETANFGCFKKQLRLNFNEMLN